LCPVVVFGGIHQADQASLNQVVDLHARRQLGHQVVGNPLYERGMFMDVIFCLQVLPGYF